ncbi:MAG: hypothetical protein IPM29_28525 [Planctomycetes bacterium]|nr:hypothetical protein [Planctomycetota bacterium]
MLRTLILLASAASTLVPAQTPRSPTSGPEPVDPPFVFEQNGGRYDPAVAFVARGPGFTEFLTRDASWLVVRDGSGDTDRRRALALRTRFVGARGDARLEGREASATRVHHLIGDDPSRWSTHNETFVSVVHRGVWHGIDMVHLRAGDRLRYDFVVSPGADAHRIELAFDGVDACRIAADGALVLETALGTVTHSAPVLFELDDEGHRAPVAGRFEERGPGRIGFAVGPRDPSRTLIIDPVLDWTSYLGGSGVDAVHDVAVAPNGDVVAVGETFSPDLPTTPGVFQAGRLGSHDAFIGKLVATGSAFVWCTYLGGTNNPYGAFTPRDFANGVALRSDGSVAVGGRTNTGDFPTTPGAFRRALFQTSDSTDAFVTVLASDGASLVWSTFLGGASNADGVNAIAVGPGDDVWVTGATSHGFPVTSGAWLTGFVGPNGAAFVTRFRYDGVLAWSTYLGTAGTSFDSAFDLDVDAQGRAYVVGVTRSATMPTPNGFATASHGGRDVFLARMSADGSSLGYATYVGDSGNQDEAYPPGVAALDDGRAWVTTWADNSTFAATPGAFQTASGGSDDAVLLCIDTNRSGIASLLWATYLGGSGQDFGRSVIVAADGTCAVAGQTLSTDFPTAQALQPCNRGGRDLFVSAFDGQGALRWSTYHGGINWEPAAYNGLYAALAGDPNGVVALAGNTGSPDLGTPGAAQPILSGTSMGLVTRLVAGTPVQASATVRSSCTPGAVVAQSIRALDPRPMLSRPFRVGIDDPTNSAGLTPNATMTFWLLSVLPLASHPCGPTLPGYGPNGGVGELLIDAMTLPAIARGPVRWSGPGNAAVHTLQIPCHPGLAGRTVYTQAFFLDNNTRVVFGESIDLLLGF